jgi:hypothetical protein
MGIRLTKTDPMVVHWMSRCPSSAERPTDCPVWQNRWTYVVGVPLIAMSATGTMKPEAKGAPLERWQSRQWQLSITTGGREHT